MPYKRKEDKAAQMRRYRKRTKEKEQKRQKRLLDHLKVMATYSRIVRASFLYHVTNFAHRNDVSFNAKYGDS